jgi:hypothetical protein
MFPYFSSMSVVLTSFQDAVMPVVLENHQRALDAQHKGYRDAKSDPLVMPRYPNNPPKVNVIQREGRPAVKFVDVGGKFVDVKDRLKRIKLAERRQRMKDAPVGTSYLTKL